MTHEIWPGNVIRLTEPPEFAGFWSAAEWKTANDLVDVPLFVVARFRGQALVLARGRPVRLRLDSMVLAPLASVRSYK